MSAIDKVLSDYDLELQRLDEGLEITRLCKLNSHKRASLGCAARLADTLCPSEAPFGRLGSHWLIIREIASDSISKYVCPTVIQYSDDVIDITRKITKFVNFKIFDA